MSKQCTDVQKVPHSALIKDKLLINTVGCEHLWEGGVNDGFKTFLQEKMTLGLPFPSTVTVETY